MREKLLILKEQIRAIFLKENIQTNEPPFYLTAEIVRDMLKNSYDLDEQIPLKIILSYLESDNLSMKADIQEVYNKIMKKIHNIIQQRLQDIGLSINNVNIDWKPTIRHIIQKIFNKNQDINTFIFYVYSKNANKNNSIGLIYKNHTFDFFEGNDYSDSETIQIANKIVYGNAPKYKKIYGSHGHKVVDAIEKTGLLPAGLYVSPSKEYAESYWGEDRILFSGIININDVSPESDVDWKVIQDTPIKNFRYE